MSADPADNDERRRAETAFRISWLWIIGSGLGALAGVVVALIIFPSVVSGENPIGQFSWHLVGFALAIGLLLAVSQWLILYGGISTPISWALRTVVGAEVGAFALHSIVQFGPQINNALRHPMASL